MSSIWNYSENTGLNHIEYGIKVGHGNGSNSVRETELQLLRQTLYTSIFIPSDLALGWHKQEQKAKNKILIVTKEKLILPYQ
jgi:hypothetical protein